MKRAVCASLLFACVAGPAFAAPAAPVSERCLLYVVERIDPAAAPAIDGTLSEDVWHHRGRIDTLRNFLGSRTGDFASQRSEFTVLCDGTNLFVGATFHEAEMKKLKASPAHQPFWNDCIEVYFDPRHDGRRSIQLVVDCIGQRMWQKHYNEGYGWWADTAWYMLADWEGKSVRGSAVWTVEIRIDCASFEIDPTPGGICGFNPCRFRLGAGDEFSAWGFGGGKRQKSMPHWGHLLFAAAGDKAQGREVTLDDVRRIYGDLQARRVEVPVAAGFRVFTGQGTDRVTFAEQLAPELSQCEQLAVTAADTAESARRQLGDTSPFATRLDDTLAGTRALLEGVRKSTLTIGAYDRALAALASTRAELSETMWQARTALLVADVQPGGKGR